MRKAIIFGLLGSLALLSLYFVIMRLGSGSWDYTVRELIRLRFWVAPLIVGFGIQVGLFTYLKNCSMASNMEKGATATGPLLHQLQCLLVVPIMRQMYCHYLVYQQLQSF